VDFDQLGDYKDAFEGCDVGFNTLGTTRGKSGPVRFYNIIYVYLQMKKLTNIGSSFLFLF
jgi:hypothetical protein